MTGMLDRVLDRGVVIDAWLQAAGISLIEVDAHRCPSRVRCPSDRGQACPVAATALAA
jgi:gas vesicle protein GvpA/GvpJ/GvpM family